MLVAVLALAAPAAAHHGGADPLPWSQFLPPFETVKNPQPHATKNCRKAKVRCIRRVLRRLERMRARFGCDPRAIFPTTYWHVTRLVIKRLGMFEDRKYLIRVDSLFADYFFEAFRADRLGHQTPPAWQIAFDAWESGDTNAGQDMLLGINAHVQRDMPFVLAEFGLWRRDGSSRKGDHEVMNRVLSEAYDHIVRDIGERYDPLVTWANADPSPLDDHAGVQLVRSWREGVWRNAERLLNARTAQDYAQVAQQIEDNAAAWARSFVAVQQPGYREQRLAYCQSRGSSP